MSNSNNSNLPSAENRSVSRPYVMITGYYGFDNLGDEAILEELITELSSVCDKENIVVLSNSPKKTSASHGVKSISRWDWLKFISLLKRTNVLISGGGGLFQDRTGPRSVIFYATQIFLAQFVGTKIFIYAQGLGPLNTVLGRQLTKLAFAQADSITLRDNNSINMLKSWGLDAALTSDPVWAMQPSALPQPAQSTLDNLRMNPADKIIGISLRNDIALADYHLNLLAQAIAKKFPTTSSILLLPFQINQDLEPLKKIDKYLQELGFKTSSFDPSLLNKPSHWLALMQNLDLVIGMRMHALLMALQAGRPVIGIAYDPKVSLLLNEFKQPLLPLDLKDEEETRAKWFKIVDEAMVDNLSGFACTKLEATKQLALQNSLHLTNSLRG